MQRTWLHLIIVVHPWSRLAPTATGDITPEGLCLSCKVGLYSPVESFRLLRCQVARGLLKVLTQNKLCPTIQMRLFELDLTVSKAGLLQASCVALGNVFIHLPP